MSETELLPCPDCGASASTLGICYWKKDPRYYRVECDNCPRRTGDFRHRADAAAAWNRRAPDDRDLSDALIEHVNYTSELQQQLDDIRRALRGYPDSDLASLAGTMMVQRHYLAECLIDGDIDGTAYDLARSILDDEPAPDELHPSTIAALEAGEFITEAELRDSLPAAYDDTQVDWKAKYRSVKYAWKRSCRDWIAMLREIAELSDLIGLGDGDWADADAATLLEQFDPWYVIREAKKRVKPDEPAPEPTEREALAAQELVRRFPQLLGRVDLEGIAAASRLVERKLEREALIDALDLAAEIVYHNDTGTAISEDAVELARKVILRNKRLTGGNYD